ncbi:Rrf2 family nitric oxide-sensitive transcriptional repressor [Sphingomonas vulcanisoli]|uniref:Rrf2 family nitric oxide-sensitive transcriptional repressor n=1 Tax=Sphingomonas vulcanisoli TaxID=1658060 RepID=A0ABX0TV68_9SPHN|nr:Rrf2 family transcriptional regulator [Sphingomonas vulcanisoli]NIJ09407.1 Rrf2 family nitric oxide-sensitive transcriptional repressor [Sphingomonas vulcanisoli]
MELSQKTDDALRVLLHLGERPDHACTIWEISRAHDISHLRLTAVVADLVRADILHQAQDRSGSVHLVKAPDDIVLSDIVRLSETGLERSDCTRCRIRSDCVLRAALAGARQAFLDALSTISLHDVLLSDQGDPPCFHRTG